MTARGVEFLNEWVSENVTPFRSRWEMAERLIADTDKVGLSLDDLEPELGAPETLVREALESDEGTRGD